MYTAQRRDDVEYMADRVRVFQQVIVLRLELGVMELVTVVVLPSQTSSPGLQVNPAIACKAWLVRCVSDCVSYRFRRRCVVYRAS